MKVLLPISLLFLGVVALFVPILVVAFLQPKTEITFFLGSIVIFTPIAAGVTMIGFGIYLAFKSYGNKGD